MNIRRLNFIAIIALLICWNFLAGAQTENTGFIGGESIHRLSLASTLGETGFQFNLRAEFQSLEIDTNNFNLHLSAAYGVLPGLDFALYLPFFSMSQGLYYKNGLGDAVFSLKYLRTKPTMLPFNWGLQSYLLIPTGYQKEVYGFPPFSQDKFGFGGRFLFGLEGKKISLTANVGPFIPEKAPGAELFYGCGAKIHLLGKFLMASCEFTSQKQLQNSASQSFAFGGVETNLPFIGVGLKTGVESKLKADEPLKLVAGVSLTFRRTLPGVTKGILETKGYYEKIMLFDFLDEEQNFMGDNVEPRLARNLGSIKDISIVQPSVEVDCNQAVKDRGRALTEAQQDTVDLLIFGQYHSFGYEKKPGFQIPYLIGFPRTVAYISADIWVIDTKNQEQIFTQRVTGKASRLRGVALFPLPGEDNILQLDTSEQEKLRKKAIDDFVHRLSALFSNQLD